MKSESRRVKYKAFIRPCIIENGELVYPPMWPAAKAPKADDIAQDNEDAKWEQVE